MSEEAQEDINTVLESIAVALEARAGNPVYQAAWRTAAKLVRAYKKNDA
jgi:hypothetical protein